MANLKYKSDNPHPEEPSEPKYPYGMRICLDNDTIKMLEMEEMPEVGHVMKLQAVVKVISVSVDEYEGKTSKRIEMQITDADFSHFGENKEKRNLEEELYGVPRDRTKEGSPTFVNQP